MFSSLKNFFAPHAIIKALCYSAERTLMLLPELFNREKLHRVLSHPGYPHAREVVMTLNAIRWQDPEMEAKLPIQNEQQATQHAHNPKKKRQRHRSRRNRNPGQPPQE